MPMGGVIGGPGRQSVGFGASLSVPVRALVYNIRILILSIIRLIPD